MQQLRKTSLMLLRGFDVLMRWFLLTDTIKNTFYKHAYTLQLLLQLHVRKYNTLVSSL